MAAICTRGDLKVWDVGSASELLSKSVDPKRQANPENSPLPNLDLRMSLSPDGETVATTEPDSNAVTVWNVSDGTSRRLWQTDDLAITHVAHSSDGKWVATTNSDGVIRLWDVSTTPRVVP